ncbi:MAG TPA: histidine kinase [Candidatus Eisenbacteria bacterium]|nr:histidine kinase [Candidatus Eisenbacteria bacterium]
MDENESLTTSLGTALPRTSSAGMTSAWWRMVRVLVVIGGVAFSVLAEAQQLAIGRPAVFLVADLLGGWAFLAAGAVAWDRRPSNRIGPLLVAIGFAWFVGTFGAASSDLVAYLGRSFQGYYEPLLAILVLAYPTGRLTSRWSRLVAVAWLVDHSAWSVARAVLDRPLAWYTCPSCPETIDAYVNARVLLDRIGPITLTIAVVLAGAVLVLLVARLMRAGPAGRRRLTPVVLGGIVLALDVGVTGIARLTIGPPLFQDARIGAGYNILAMLVAVSVLVGLLQDRLARSDVADLVLELRSAGLNGRVRRIQDALAHTLHDPTLRFLALDPMTGRYRDADGDLVAAPVPDTARAVTRSGGGAAPEGLIVHDPVLLEDSALLDAAQAAVAFESENARLGAEVARQLEEVRASRQRIVQAADSERRRVERDLHDGAQQRLIGLAMEVGRLRAQARQRGDEELSGSLGAVAANVESAIEELRELARGILPPILAEAGLAAAIESLAVRSPIPVRVDVVVDGRLPPTIESTAYFVVAEGLANVARHSAAREATVTGRVEDGRLRLVVEDDGIGGADARRGSGLRGLADRVGALGGRLEVGPMPGSGTRLAADLPVAR